MLPTTHYRCNLDV